MASKLNLRFVTTPSTFAAINEMADDESSSSDDCGVDGDDDGEFSGQKKLLAATHDAASSGGDLHRRHVYETPATTQVSARRTDTLMQRGAVVAAIADREYTNSITGACMALFSLSGVSFSTLKLLHCTTLLGADEQGDGSAILFYAGYQKCNYFGWQLPLVIWLGVLILVLVSPVIYWLLLQRKPNNRRGGGCKNCRYVIKMFQFVGEYANEPFRPGYWHWSAVLAIQWIATAACPAFAPSDAASSVCVTMLSMLFLVLHLLAKPYRTEWVDQLALAACVCLSSIGVMNSIISSFSSVSFDTSNTPMESLEAGLEYGISILLFVPPVSLCGLWLLNYQPHLECGWQQGL